jgi:hypothetical protein
MKAYVKMENLQIPQRTLFSLHCYEQQYVFLQPSDDAIHKPDSKENETTGVTSQVIASFLSKLAETSLEGSTSLFLSAIEHTSNLE